MVAKRSKKRSYPKKWKKAIGGKLIGKGAHGCIYYPKLDTIGPCSIKNTEYNKNKYVTKVLKLRKAKQEITYSRLITSNIPRWEKYFIIPDEICIIDINSTTDDRNNFENCKQYDKRTNQVSPMILFGDKKLYSDVDETYVGLHMEKATSDLDDLLLLKNIDITSLSFEDLVRSMIPLYEGINELSKKEIVHQDIKSANIVYSHEKKQMFLIDVGLAQKFEESFTPAKGNLHQYQYFVYPFDWKLGYLPNNVDDYSYPMVEYLNATENSTPYIDKKDFKLVFLRYPEIIGFYSRVGYQKSSVNYLNVLNPIYFNFNKQTYLRIDDASELYKDGMFMVRGTFKYILEELEQIMKLKDQLVE